jgi:hypothetical protein
MIRCMASIQYQVEESPFEDPNTTKYSVYLPAIERIIDSFGIIESTKITTAPPELNTSSSFMTTTFNQQALLLTPN